MEKLTGFNGLDLLCLVGVLGLIWFWNCGKHKK